MPLLAAALGTRCRALGLSRQAGTDAAAEGWMQGWRSGLLRLIASRVSQWNRGRKLRSFAEVLRPTSATRVLDVGFSDHEYGDYENYLEKHYPWPRQLTVLGTDEPRECPKKYPDISFVRYDGELFPFETDSFDVACSNAVLEHVGGYDRQVLFVREMARVAPSVWITTPSRAFPIDTHTLIPLAHWLSRRMRDAIYSKLGKRRATGDSINLLYKGEIKRILRAAGVERYAILTNRIAFLPLDYVLVIRGSR
jgi:Methyltransferase domain